MISIGNFAQTAVNAIVGDGVKLSETVASPSGKTHIGVGGADASTSINLVKCCSALVLCIF